MKASRRTALWAQLLLIPAIVIMSWPLMAQEAASSIEDDD